MTLSVVGAQGLSAVLVDSQDRLIIADRSRSFVYVLEESFTLVSGAVAPDRELSAGDLHSPRGLFLIPE